VGCLRRWIRRVERDAREDSIVIRLQDGSTRVFPMRASLEFTVACWAEGMAADKGEEYTWDPEMERLKKALENATPESRDEFYANYAIIWEDSCGDGHAEK
jgi:hypothetical protein